MSATEVCPDARPVEGRVLTNASLIPIGKGETAPLGELLAARHRRCRFCSEGWVHRPVPGGAHVSSVCGCCVLGWRARMGKAARASTPAIGIAALPSPAEEARAQRRVDRLARDLVALEQERARRVATFEARNADLIGAAKSAAATAQDESALALKAEAEVGHLASGMADVEKRLAIFQAAHAGAVSMLAAHRQARELAQAMQADAEAEIERRRGTLALAALDKEIAKTRRRLAGARSDLGGEPPAPEAA